MMSDRVNLIGADEIERAGRNIAAAAETMARAANAMQAAAEQMKRVQSDIDYTLSSHQRFLAKWADDLSETLQERLEGIELHVMKNGELIDGLAIVAMPPMLNGGEVPLTVPTETVREEPID